MGYRFILPELPPMWYLFKNIAIKAKIRLYMDQIPIHQYIYIVYLANINIDTDIDRI